MSRDLPQDRSERAPSRDAHGIEDHFWGGLEGHDHGSGLFDHDHDHDFPEDQAPPRTSFLSLGVDIGSSSTQVAFSRLEAQGGGWQRRTLFLSPVAPTPFLPDGLIDAARLRQMLIRAYLGAGLTPDAVETGVIILTGEAAARANARTIAAETEDLGEMVCAAAGHHLEARLAAHGSGAVSASLGGRRVLSIDIGGGTTKLALIEDGQIRQTAALSAGGRLAVIDRQNRLLRLDPAGRTLALRAGLDWQAGAQIDPAERAQLAEVMAGDIVDAATGCAQDPLWLTPPLRPFGALDGVHVSGGVGEYVHARESRDFNDLGRALGHALSRRIAAGAVGAPLLPPGECIRATVLGAAEHSLSRSGETSFISNHRELLPRRRLPVIAPPCDLSTDEIDAAAVGEAIRGHLAGFDLLADPTRPVALALRWQGIPEHARIAALARGIAQGLGRHVAARTPLYILIDGDLALSLGRILKQELRLPSEILVLDRILVSDFSYVDLGRIRLPSHTVPVTIRTLVFGGEQG